ncbi:IclR family transcriptional regulator [Pelagibacterium lacus]|nr:helix-turn-helix domain-containing protein [Pelagibacterium lacus]
MAESTISRAFLILDMLGEERSTISPEEIALALNTTRSTTYRYIKTLCDTGFLMQLSRGAYALGPRIVELERKIQLSDPLVNTSRPFMRDHAASFANSTLLLCGLWGDRVLCLHQEAAPSTNGEPAIIQRARGIPFSLFKGAASLSILASLPLAKRRAIYLQSGKEIEEAGLGDSWDAFRRTTRSLRDRGYVVTSGSFGSNLIAVAAPILDADGAALGSITRIAPISQKSSESDFSADVRAIVQNIQDALRHAFMDRSKSPPRRARK